MSSDAREYEKYVRDITQALLNAQGLETVKVEHLTVLPPKGSKATSTVTITFA